MSFLTFPVTGNYQSLSPGGNVRGNVKFTSNILAGMPPKGLTDSTHYGILVAPVTATILNGVLTPTSSFSTSVTLYSNDPQFNLTGNLQYIASFSDVTVDGIPVTVDSFTFSAPADGTPVDLVAVSPGGALQIVSGLPTVTSSGISDATTVGLALLTASTAAAARAAISALGNTDIATLQNKTLDTSNIATLKDSQFTVVDDSDATKAMQFQLSGFTTGSTRVISIPDATTTMVGTGTAQALLNKDMTSVSNTFPTLNQNTTGNAATATKLATARNIAGVSFDGTANISLTSGTSAQKANGTGGFTSATLDDVGPLAADYSLNNHKLTNLADPVSAQDAATKAYVDAVVQGLDVKSSANCATVGTETFTIVSGSVTQITGTTVDGYTPAVNDRILIKDAPASTGAGSVNSTQPGNGIYKVTANTTNLTVTRATDQAGTNNPLGDFVFVDGGTANGNGGYVVTVPSTAGAFTYGSGNIKWTQFSGAGEVINGTGLSKSGNTLSLTTPVAVTNGGTGGGSITGLVKGNGTSAFTAATVGTDYLAPGGILGTPSSGTLTNCTGLPVAGITASTATALGVGSVELGNASDTTLSRSSAGVLAVEGVVIPSISSANVLTNKSIDLTNNTLTGTTAQFNTALTDGDFATTAQLASAQQMQVTTKTTAYTFVAGDAGTVVEFNNASTPATFTINAGVHAVGDSWIIRNINTALLTIAAGASVTIRQADSHFNITGQWREASVHCRATNEFVLIGDLS